MGNTIFTFFNYFCEILDLILLLIPGVQYDAQWDKTDDLLNMACIFSYCTENIQYVFICTESV